MKNKKAIAVTVLIGAIIILAGTAYYYKNSPHKKITPESVFSVQLWGAGIELHNAGGEEKKQIIEQFNSMRSIRRNNDFKGTTPDAGIVINLKSGEHISIIRSGSDFEVQSFQGDEPISYWGKNKYLKDVLNRLAVEVDD